MKLLTRIFIIIGFAFLNSCQFTEKINFNENGSGTYRLKIDMSAMMSSMNEMNKENDIEHQKQEIVDTIIKFGDILETKKDSIAKLPDEEQKQLQSLEDLKLHIDINEKENKMITEFIFDFKNVEDLKNIQEKIKKANAVSSDKADNDEPVKPTEVAYHFNGKIFHREIIKKDLTEEQKEAYKKSLEQSGQMLEGSTYQIEYHFARPIKSTTYKDATFSADRKTLFIMSDLKKITDNPELMDFKVILK